MMPLITVAQFKALMQGARVDSIDLATTEALQGAQTTVEGHLGFSLTEYANQPLPADIRACVVRLAHCRLNPTDGHTLELIRAQVERELRPYRREPARNGVAA